MYGYSLISACYTLSSPQINVFRSFESSIVNPGERSPSAMSQASFVSPSGDSVSPMSFAHEEVHGECFIAGDSKTNQRSLLGLSKDIPGNLVHDIGIELEFDFSDTDRFHRMNTMGNDISTEGTLKMLRTWYEKTPQADMNNQLKSALQEAGLINLIEKYFKVR